MKKILITVLMLSISSFLFGQVYSNTDKAMITAKIDTLIANYMQKSGLTLPGVSKRNDKVVADLRALIKTDAEIFDDINAEYNEVTHQYELKNKSRNDYIEELVDRFPKEGLTITNKSININYNSFDKHEVLVALSRKIKGTSFDKFIFENDDTLLITIGILPDRTVKITNITKIGSNLRCLNDKDNDGVIDEADECADELGVIALNGCPDWDVDGIPDKRDHCPREKGAASNDGCPPSTFAYQLVFSGGIGTLFSLNKLDESLPLSGLQNYPDLDPEQSNLSAIRNPSKRTPAINYHITIAYYFGKTSNKTKGISLGVYYSHYEDVYSVGGSKFFYRQQQPGSSDQFYHQVDSLSSDAKEEVKFSVFNFPLMFRYRAKLNQKLAAEISIGPSLYLLSLSSNLSQGKVDYGIIYEYDQNGNYEYTSGGYNPTNEDWIVTRSYILKQSNQDPAQAAAYVQDLFNRKYNVGFDQPVSSTNPIKSRSSFGLNLNLDLFYHIDPKTAVKFGAQYVQSSTKGKNSEYRMVGNRSENIQYTSVFDNEIASKYSAYGFSIGIILGLY